MIYYFSMIIVNFLFYSYYLFIIYYLLHIKNRTNPQKMKKKVENNIQILLIIAL